MTNESMASRTDFSQSQILWDRDEILLTIERDENYQTTLHTEERDDNYYDDDNDEDEDEDEEDLENYERIDQNNNTLDFDDEGTSDLGAEDLPQTHGPRLNFDLSSSPTCSSRQSTASEIRFDNVSPATSNRKNRKHPRQEEQEQHPSSDNLSPPNLPRRVSRPTLISRTRTPEETKDSVNILLSESEEFEPFLPEDPADDTSETDNEDIRIEEAVEEANELGEEGEHHHHRAYHDDRDDQIERAEEEEAEEDQDEDEDGDDDVDSQAAEVKQRRNEALSEFSGIEKRFAELRTQMFYERMLALKREAELLEAGKHAELTARQREIKRNLETRKCIANAWLEYTREAHKRQLEMVKYQTKYTFEARKSELRCMLIEDRQRMKYQLNREKRLLDAASFSYTAADHISAVRIHKQEQGKVTELIQIQLAHGFPAAVLPGLSPSDINDDLVAIGVLKPQKALSPGRTVHHKSHKRPRKDKHSYSVSYQLT